MTKKIFTLVSVLIVAVMIISACGTPAATTPAPVATQGPAATNPPAATQAQAATSAPAEPPYELVIAHFVGDVPADEAMVVDALNKLLVKKINATTKMIPLGFGVYSNQTNLMLSSNEKLDLLVTSTSMGFSTQVASGQLQPLDDLLSKYGQGISAALGPAYTSAAKINGHIYGIPSERDFAAYTNLTCRKDMIDKYKIDTTKITKLEDIEAALKPIKDGEPGMAPLMTLEVGTSFLPAITASAVDVLGDFYGVLMNQGQDSTLKVTDLFETPEYAAWLKLFHQWYADGYVIKDVATQTDQTKSSLVKNGKVACYLNRAKPGFDTQEIAMAGMPLVSMPLLKPLATTSSVANVMWSIPVNSKNPQKAMQFLNLLYTDPEVVNMLDWGIEGTHYVIKSGQVIDYPSGKTASNVGYSGFGWMWGDQFLSYVLTTDDPNIWTAMKTFNDGAVKSKAMGFIFDSSSVSTEMAAVQNVYDQYRMGLETGTTDPATELPKFTSGLKDAGIDKIISAKQTQLDAWLAANK